MMTGTIHRDSRSRRRQIIRPLTLEKSVSLPTARRNANIHLMIAWVEVVDPLPYLTPTHAGRRCALLLHPPKRRSRYDLMMTLFDSFIADPAMDSGHARVCLFWDVSPFRDEGHVVNRQLAHNHSNLSKLFDAIDSTMTFRLHAIQPDWCEASINQ